MRDWISVEDKLPEKSETWKEYLIAVFVPYNDKHLVTTAMYDSRQKIWHWHPYCPNCGAKMDKKRLTKEEKI